MVRLTIESKISLTRKGDNMYTLLIIIGVCFIIAGFLGKKEQRRRNDFEDYTWFHFEDHGWNEDKPRSKKKKK